METILGTWYYQLLILLVVWLLMQLGVKKVPFLFPKRLLPVDIVVVFMLGGIYFLTLNQRGNSALPYVLLGMATWGILMTLVDVLLKRELVYRVFFLRYWRFVDLGVIVLYTGIVIFTAVK
ncbi:DUF3397 family protein [Liquorilactobacillus capillatus]|uniref:Integral membrane protein n=1 Tax=Liquorilactobacillus capillatus DSM 19910 TaxID=1423731 RepID=A0A0R1M8W8_9LACO|nr:DUF3397 family protein [Liquorilactobacillus capillatus]KRL01426.1 hypothetical protein FC81_GL001571 [Liquorilactobacillus capillatus DSM 19910]